MTPIKTEWIVKSENSSQKMNVKDVCQYLKVSERTLRTLVSDREIPFTRIKGCIRFDKVEIDRWFKQMSQRVRVS